MAKAKNIAAVVSKMLPFAFGSDAEKREIKSEKHLSDTDQNYPTDKFHVQPYISKRVPNDYDAYTFIKDKNSQLKTVKECDESWPLRTGLNYVPKDCYESSDLNDNKEIGVEFRSKDLFSSFDLRNSICSSLVCGTMETSKGEEDSDFSNDSECSFETAKSHVGDREFFDFESENGELENKSYWYESKDQEPERCNHFRTNCFVLKSKEKQNSEIPQHNIILQHEESSISPLNFSNITNNLINSDSSNQKCLLKTEKSVFMAKKFFHCNKQSSSKAEDDASITKNYMLERTKFSQKIFQPNITFHNRPCRKSKERALLKIKKWNGIYHRNRTITNNTF